MLTEIMVTNVALGFLANQSFKLYITFDIFGFIMFFVFLTK